MLRRAADAHTSGDYTVLLIMLLFEAPSSKFGQGASKSFFSVVANMVWNPYVCVPQELFIDDVGDIQHVHYSRLWIYSSSLTQKQEIRLWAGQLKDRAVTFRRDKAILPFSKSSRAALGPTYSSMRLGMSGSIRLLLLMPSWTAQERRCLHLNTEAFRGRWINYIPTKVHSYRYAECWFVLNLCDVNKKDYFFLSFFDRAS